LFFFFKKKIVTSFYLSGSRDWPISGGVINLYVLHHDFRLGLGGPEPLVKELGVVADVEPRKKRPY
jgi:hypothetical protein